MHLVGDIERVVPLSAVGQDGIDGEDMLIDLVFTLMGALAPDSFFSLQLQTATAAIIAKSTFFIVDSVDCWCKNSAKVACVSVLIVG